MDSPLDRTFAAVIFDLDGTLVDSTAAVVRSWVRWAREEGLDPLRLEHSHGVPAAQIVAAVLPPARRASALARIADLELADAGGITMLPGAAEALRALSGARTAIATSCTALLARARMASAGLVRPEVVVTADDVEAGKPAPDPFLLAAERLGCAASDCLVVEDAPSGLAAARAAGCAALAVTTTTAATRLEAAAVVPDLSWVTWHEDAGRITLTVADGPSRHAAGAVTS